MLASIDIAKRTTTSWAVNRDGPWVSKTDMVQFERCAYRVFLAHRDSLPYDSFLPPSVRHVLLERGTAIEEDIVTRKGIESAESIDEARKRDGLVIVPGVIRNHDLGISGRPDMLFIKDGRLMPVEVKSHKEVKQSDELELAFYWRLLEPIQKGRRNRGRKGYVVLSTNKIREVVIYTSTIDRVDALIDNVRSTKMKGIEPALVAECDHCLMKEEHLPIIYGMSDLSLIFDVGPVRRWQFIELGIRNIGDLAVADIPAIHSNWVSNFEYWPTADQLRRMQSHATAFLEGEPQVFGGKPVPSLEKSLILDLEYESAASRQVFELGVLVTEDGAQASLHQEFAESAQDEERILNAMFSVLRRFEDYKVVTWSGNAADMPALIDACTRLGLAAHLIDDLKRRHVDLFEYTRDNIRLPAPGLGLKSVAKYFGFARDRMDFSSFFIPWDYAKYLKTRDVGLRERILEHNAADLRSVLHVWRELERISLARETIGA